MVLVKVAKKRIQFQKNNYTHIHNTHIFSKFENKTHIFQIFTRIKKKPMEHRSKQSGSSTFVWLSFWLSTILTKKSVSANTEKRKKLIATFSTT